MAENPRYIGEVPQDDREKEIAALNDYEEEQRAHDEDFEANARRIFGTDNTAK